MASRDTRCRCAGLLGLGWMVMEHCMRAQGVSFAGGPLASLRSPHQTGPMEMSQDMRLVPHLCAWWLFLA